MSPKKYTGVVVPTVTPFTKSGQLDIHSVEKLIDHIVTNNCSPFILGTSGEALSTSLQMKKDFLNTAVKINNNRKTFYAGIASMCMEDSINMAKMFFDGGADVVVSHLPSYYKLSDSSILKYFIELADNINGPMMIYNISATTHMSIPIDIVKELSKHPNIVGLKDSERDVQRMDTLLDLFKDDNDFAYQLGWAAQSTEFLRKGGDGIVPSTGNAFPQLYYKLYMAVKANDMDAANKLQSLTNNISEIYQKDKLLSEALPGLKVMLEYMNICKAGALSPCYELTTSQVNDITQAMRNLNINTI